MGFGLCGDRLLAGAKQPLPSKKKKKRAVEAKLNELTDLMYLSTGTWSR